MHFQLKHLVYPVRRMCTLTIEAVYPVTVQPHQRYTLSIRPFSGLRLYGLRGQASAPTARDAAFFLERHELIMQDGCLTLKDLQLPQEDCYICRLYADGQEVQTLELYALEDDLLGKTPYKGDNHLHTCLTDGNDSPMYMAAASCMRGYDYCAITDHKLIGPSIMARDFYQDTGVDFLILPGEEVHSPDNPVHLISLGSETSVNDWWRNHEDEYRAAVEKELAGMQEPMLPEDRYTAAATQVMFDKIREVGGVSILCHSHWILANGFNETEDVTDYLLDHRRFDALELLAGAAGEVGSQLQLSYYRTRETMPVLGDSDAHGCFGGELEPGNYTIVFADSLDCESIKQAICAQRCIAGNEQKLYGDYRLVKYGYFLMRNFFPEHDCQRKKLGVQMLRMAAYPMHPPQELLKSLLSPRPSELFAPRRCE